MRNEASQDFIVVPVGAGSLDRLLALIEAFHRDGGYPLRDAQRDAVRRLVCDPELGCAWMLTSASSDVGFATCAFALSVDAGGQIAILDDLYIVPSCRGRGLGHRLMRQLETDLAGIGVRGISLRADGYDGRVRRFYEGLGFTASPLVTFEKTCAAAA